MNEIYWITRIGVVNKVALVLCVIIGVLLAFLITFYLIDNYYSKDIRDTCVKVIRIASVALVILFLAAIFIPSKKDLLLIYGVGGTIDYIKDNNNAKQLPDKCIKALDAYLDELTKDED